MSIAAQDLGFDAHERDLYLGSYVALATMLGQMIGSITVGVIIDWVSRKQIMVTVLYVGALSTVLFGCPFVPYWWLLVFRVFTGACQGAVVPLLFSLIGDYYTEDNRPNASAIVSSFLGGGMMVGQLFVGYLINGIGWRAPFVLIGLFAFFTALSVQMFIEEPIKGGNDQEIALLVKQGISLPPVSMANLLKNLLVPTTFLLMMQTIPNTIPWGVLCAHLHDLLATDSKLTMEGATSLMGIFGSGAAVGGLFGGFAGARLYSMNRMILPAFMGLTLGTSSFLLQGLLGMDLSEKGVMELAYPVLVLAGALGAVNGANIRIIILNLSSPELRGSSIAVLNFINCAGRGFGPLIFDIVMETLGLDRRRAICIFLNLWFVAGFLMCLASCTVIPDEERLKRLLRNFTEEHTIKKVSV